MKKYLPWLVLVVGLIGISSGTVMAIAEINKQPPELTVIAGERATETAQVAYCWENLNRAVCIDMGDAETFIAHQNIEQIIAAPSEVFQLEFEQIPITITALHEDLDGEKHLDTSATITAPSEAGSYLYTVEARFKKSKVSYAFFVEVQ